MHGLRFDTNVKHIHFRVAGLLSPESFDVYYPTFVLFMLLKKMCLVYSGDVS